MAPLNALLMMEEDILDKLIFNGTEAWEFSYQEFSYQEFSYKTFFHLIDFFAILLIFNPAKLYSN